MTRAKPHAILTVQMPPELRAELEGMAAERGESLSLTVRDLVRRAVDVARRGDSAAGVSPISAGRFK